MSYVLCFLKSTGLLSSLTTRRLSFTMPDNEAEGGRAFLHQSLLELRAPKYVSTEHQSIGFPMRHVPGFSRIFITSAEKGRVNFHRTKHTTYIDIRRSRRYVFVCAFALRNTSAGGLARPSPGVVSTIVFSESPPLRPRPFPEAAAATAAAETFAPTTPPSTPVPARTRRRTPVRLSPPALSSPPPRSGPGGGSASKARVAFSINKPSARRAHTYTHESRARTLGLRAGVVYTSGTRVHTAAATRSISRRQNARQWSCHRSPSIADRVCECHRKRTGSERVFESASKRSFRRDSTAATVRL